METIRDIVWCFVFGWVPFCGFLAWVYAMITRSSGR
jgi:hypothetical protein